MSLCSTLCVRFYVVPWSLTLSPYLTLTVANNFYKESKILCLNLNFQLLIQADMEYKSMSSSGFYFKCSVLLRFFLCYSSNPPADNLLGWNSGAWAFRVMPLSSPGRLQDNSRGYQCCTGHSKYEFLALSRAPLPMPSVP